MTNLFVTVNVFYSLVVQETGLRCFTCVAVCLCSSRLNSKHNTGRQKAPGTSLPTGPNSPTAWHNGDHTQRSRNGKAGRLNHSEGEKGHDVCNLLYFAATPPPPSSHCNGTVWSSYLCWLTWIFISFDIESFFVLLSLILKSFNNRIIFDWLLSCVKLSLLLLCFWLSLNHLGFFLFVLVVCR